MLFYFFSETARTETTRAGLQSEQLSVQSGSAGIHNKGLLKINNLCWHWNGLGGGIENTIKIKPRDNGRSREGSLRALWEGRKDSAVFWRYREEAVAAADPSGVSFFYSRTISKPVNATLRDAAWRIAKTILSNCINQSLFHSPKKLNSFLRAPCSVITVCIWRCGCWLSLQAEWYRASPFEVGFTVLNMLVWQYSLLTAKEELKILTISRVFGEWKPKQKPVTMKRLRIGVQVKTDCP